jgi:hypothetical protein
MANSPLPKAHEKAAPSTKRMLLCKAHEMWFFSEENRPTLSKTHGCLPDKRQQQKEDRDDGQYIYQRIKQRVSFRQFS